MDARLNNIIAVSSLLLALAFLFYRTIRTSSTWHATVTPLASIIGSGFLVSAPLLLLSTGQWAVFVMSAIVLVAYAIGASLRFNIRYVEPMTAGHSEKTWINKLETISRPVLGIAYIISVTFYLNRLT